LIRTRFSGKGYREIGLVCQAKYNLPAFYWAIRHSLIFIQYNGIWHKIDIDIWHLFIAIWRYLGRDCKGNSLAEIEGLSAGIVEGWGQEGRGKTAIRGENMEMGIES